MYQKYLDPVIEEFTTGEYYREVFNAKEEFFQFTGTVYEEDAEFEARMCIFMDWYIFDRPLSKGGLPPIKLYFKDNKERFSNEDLNVYKDLCATVHSIFKLTRKAWFRKGVVVKDLFTGKSYIVQNQQIKHGLFEARIIPYKGKYEFSMGFCFHPVEIHSFIFSEVKKIKNDVQDAHTRLMQRLSAMKLKHLRFQHIDIRHIYSYDSKF